MDTAHTTMESLAEMFNARMATFEEELRKATPRTNTVSSLMAEFQSFRAFVVTSLSALQKQIEILSTESDNCEMRSRRKMLLLHGVPENKEEDTLAVVVETINRRLSLSVQADAIGRAFRMGRQMASKPRPILIKFCSHDVRTKAWQAKTKLKGSGITLSEFLTKRRHDVFMAARKRFGMAKCWTREGYIVISGPDGKRHRVSSFCDLNRISGVISAENAGGSVCSGSVGGEDLVDPADPVSPVAAVVPAVKKARAATALKKK